MKNRGQYFRDPEVNRISGFQGVTGDNSQPNSLNHVSELQGGEDYPKQIPVLAIAPNAPNLAQEKLQTPKKIREEQDPLDLSQSVQIVKPRSSFDKQEQKVKTDADVLNDSGRHGKISDSATKKEQKKTQKKQAQSGKEKQKDTDRGAKSGQQQQQGKKPQKLQELQQSSYTFHNLYAHLPVIEKRDIQTLLESHKVSQVVQGDTLVQVAKLGRLIAEDEIRNVLDRVKLMLLVLHTVVERYNDFSDTSETYLHGILHHINTVIDFFSKCHALTIAQGNAVRGLKKIIQKLQLHIKSSNFGDTNGQNQKAALDRRGSIRNSYSLKNQFSYSTNEGDVKKDLKAIIKQYIQSYIETKIIYSGSNIVSKAAEKLQKDDVVMIYGYQQNIIQVLKLANRQDKNITAVVVDGQPHMTGRKAVRELVAAGIDCKYVYITGLQMVVRQTTKLVLQAEAVGSNGAVLGLSGSGQLAIQAHFNLIPVIVCSESCRFSEKKFLSPLSYNKLVPYHGSAIADHSQHGEKDALQDIEKLDLMLDVTDPTKITTIITEEECYAPQTLSTIIQEYVDEQEY